MGKIITVHRSGGRIFAQPTTNLYKIGWVVFQPLTIASSSVWVIDGWLLVSSETNNHQNLPEHGEISPDSMRSCQIHPRSSEISSDSARFLPSRAENSLVRLDPVFIVPKIDGFK